MTTSAITEYSATEAALSDLSFRFSGVVFDVATTNGFDDAKKARQEVRGYRTSLETMRKGIKAPALERCRLIDAEATRITAELVKLETPIDEQIKKEEVRKEAERSAKAEAERVRIEKIHSRIATITSWPASCINHSSEHLQDELNHLKSLEVDDSYSEFYGNAVDARLDAIAKLREMYAAKVAEEAEAFRIKQEREAEVARMKAEREELDRLRAEATECDRLAAEARATEYQLMEAQRAELVRQQKELDDQRAKMEAEVQAAAEAERQRIVAEIQAFKDAEDAALDKAIAQSTLLDRLPTEDHAELSAGAGTVFHDRFVAPLTEAQQIEERRRIAQCKEQERPTATVAPIKTVEMVTIPKALHEQLLRDSELLSCLRSAGVDSWAGWDDAIEMLDGAAA